MRGGEKLLRRAVIASLAVHVAGIAVPASWWKALARVEDTPSARKPAVEITLWVGSLGEGLPPLRGEPQVSPVEEPSSTRSAAAPGSEPASSPASPSAAPLPDLRELAGEASEVPLRPRPRGGGASAAGEGENPYVPPRLLAGALPIDPQDSKALQVPAEIPVRLRVGVDGKVLEVVPELDDLPPTVLAALRRSAAAMRFTPAHRGTVPVEAWFPMTFVYRK